MERKVFRGIGAVIAAVETDRKFDVVVKMSHNNATDFSPSKRIPIDLDRSPSKSASWNEIEVDDRGIDATGVFLGGAMRPGDLRGFHVTTLGGYLGASAPDDLARGCFVGGVFLEEEFFERQRDKIELDGTPWPAEGVRSYQLMTVAYSNSPMNGASAGKRYAGMHGKVKATSNGLATIELFDLTGASKGEVQVNLRSAEDVDTSTLPLAAGETLLTDNSQVGASGAVFLSLTRLAGLKIENPKLPLALGA